MIALLASDMHDAMCMLISLVKQQTHTHIPIYLYIQQPTTNLTTMILSYICAMTDSAIIISNLTNDFYTYFIAKYLSLK